MSPIWGIANPDSDVERGKREVGIITMHVIAAGLDTTMADLRKGF